MMRTPTGVLSGSRGTKRRAARWMLTGLAAVFGGLLSGCSSGGYQDEADLGLGVDARAVDRDLGTDDLGTVDMASLDLAPPDPCGCHAGQTCVSGKCEFLCTGVRVPADVATLSAAVKGIESTGGTICLAAGRHVLSEQLTIHPQKTLQIIGVSAERTTIQMPESAKIYLNGSLYPGEPAAQVLLAGFHLTGGVLANIPANGSSYTLDSLEIDKNSSFSQPAGSASMVRILRSSFSDFLYLKDVQGEVTSSTFRGSSGLIPLMIVQELRAVDVLVEGCHIHSASTQAVSIFERSQPASMGSGIGRIRIQNNFIAKSNHGIFIQDSKPAGEGARTFELSIVNNTLAGHQGHGILTLFESSFVTWRLTYANNVIYGNKVGVELNRVPMGSLVNRNNALFQNTTNYSLAATAGMGDLTADPQLDVTRTPWAPLPTSPLRGAADPTLAPSTDYFGRPRLPSPDIGCVQYTAVPPT